MLNDAYYPVFVTISRPLKEHAMNTNRWICLLLGSALLFTARLQAGVTNSTSGGAVFATIQAAVSAANNGDVLLVQTGRYPEALGIYDKQLELRGRYNASYSAQIAGASVVAGTGWPNPAIKATNCTITLRDIEVTGGAASGSRGGGLDLDNGVLTMQQCRVYHNTADLSGAGVNVSDGHAVLLDTSVCSNAAHGSLSGGGGIRLFGGIVTLSGATRVFDNSITGGYGGGVSLNSALLQMQGTAVRITGNRARNGGGVSVFWGGVQVLNGADICGNSASGNGGGIYLGWIGTAVVAGASSFIGHDTAGLGPNIAGENGGGIYALHESQIVLSNSAGVIHNRAGQYGGGLFLSTNVTCLISGALIGTESLTVTNFAGFSGGGVYVLAGTLALSNGAQITRGEAASGSGGGVYLSDGLLQMSSNTLIGARTAGLGNHASVFGGGIFARYASLRLTDATIQHNRADDDGGGIYLTADPVLACQRSSISYCISGGNGGGVYARAAGSAQPRAFFDRATVSYNEAAGDGGGLYWYCASALALSNATVSCNMAGADGGGIRKYGYSSTVELYRTGITHNYTGNDGGGVRISSGLLRATASDISYNLADNDTSLAGNGGGIAASDGAHVMVRATTNVTLRSNTAVHGGAIHADNATVVLDAGTNTIELRGNTANVHGGALHLVNRATLVAGDRVRIHLSRARAGGAIFASGTSSVALASATTTGIVLYANTAITTGGACCIIGPGTTLSLTNVAIGVYGGGNGATGAFACGGGIALLNGARANACSAHFVDNRSAHRGGALYAEDAAVTLNGDGSPVPGPLPTSIFTGNVATNTQGAGGACYLEHSALTAVNVALISNQAEYGGAVYLGNYATALVVNAIMARNRATMAGGAMRPYQSYVRLLHCTVADNDASGVECGPAVTAALTNCIVWGHSGTEVSTSAAVDFTDIEGGFATGARNLDANPQFAQPAAFDYQLDGASPCIGTGLFVGVNIDCLGTPRSASAPDLGAYEFVPEPTVLLALLTALITKHALRRTNLKRNT
jgi:predicted outer membrane repeat protein